MYSDCVEFSELIGQTIIHIEGDVDSDELIFTTENNKYKMYHDQDCCERVSIEDIIGDLSDLLNTPVIEAYETSDSNSDKIDGREKWTFYRIATIKGTVTIRWYGSSNGYYSESVDFEKIN
jgi:hypothetical protein